MDEATTQPRDTNTDDDPVAREAKRILAAEFAEEKVEMLSDSAVPSSTDDGALQDELTEPFPEEIEATDIGNAERLVHLHKDRIRFVPSWKQWVVWDGLKWVRDPGAVLVTELAKDVPRQLVKELANFGGSAWKQRAAWATQSANKGRITAMVDLARGVPGIVTDPNEFDFDFWAFGVGNGWIDLRDGTFHEPDPSKLMTQHTDVEWNPDAEAPTWNRVLDEWLPDEEARDYFQRLVGEAAVGLVRDHILVLIYGGGGNGKGTAIGVLQKVFGPYFVVPHKSLIIATKHEASSSEKAALFRKRLAVASETTDGSRLNEAHVKELTGNDMLQARGLYQNPFMFIPTHTLWLHTNHLPDIQDMSQGMWRRVRVLEWPTKFEGTRKDGQLPEKLEQELEGILQWVVAGAVAWGDKGLQEPASVLEATNAYKASQDLIEQFFEAIEATTGETMFCQASVVTEAWRKWTGENFGKSRGGRELKDLLEQHGYEHSGGRGPRWTGFSVPIMPK